VKRDLVSERALPGSAKIVMRDLGKVFERAGGSQNIALVDVSLEVGDGEFVCIVGPSGCGKTTLLRIVAGLEALTTGTLEMRRADEESRPANAMVFQESSLFPWLTVLDNAAFGLEMRGMSKAERFARTRPILEMVGLTRFEGHYPHQLSGGMKQRVSLARAFVNDPDILLMDEPFAALDAQTKLILQEELLRIWETHRKTVLFITHAIDEAIALADRVVVMCSSPGRIIEEIPVGFARPRAIAELKAQPAFGEMELRIWRLLESEVRGARQRNA
jgi:NitT/TauT family transport system ATP-binding protein